MRATTPTRGLAGGEREGARWLSIAGGVGRCGGLGRGADRGGVRAAGSGAGDSLPGRQRGVRGSARQEGLRGGGDVPIGLLARHCRDREKEVVISTGSGTVCMVYSGGEG